MEKCPFCGSAKVENWASRPPDKDHDIWCVFCHDCNCEGPEALTEAEALRLWNQCAIPPERSTGIGRIAAERQRLIDVEGWTPQHDDDHIDGMLAIAAACYTVGDDETYCEVKQIDGDGMIDVDGDPFPFERDNRGQITRVRRLTIAGALIAAEIDRELRAAFVAGRAE